MDPGSFKNVTKAHPGNWSHPGQAMHCTLGWAMKRGPVGRSACWLLVVVVSLPNNVYTDSVGLNLPGLV